jgi:chaperonin GroES
MRIRPIGERVVLKPLKGEERTKSGVYLPSKEDKKQGIVEQSGTTKEGKELPLNKGDVVIYGGYSHEEIEVKGEKFLIVDFKDILAKIEESTGGSYGETNNL